MLYATVRQRKIHVKNPVTVIQNGVGVDQVALDMDDEWKDMTSIVCVFQNGETKKEKLHTFGQLLEVPWECLTQTGRLMLSCTGYMGSEKIMTTMLPDSFWNVVQNGPVTGDVTLEPTPTLYEQVLEAAAAAHAMAEQLRLDKESGVFNGTSVTIADVTQAEESGGESTVAFSDGKELRIKNGRDGYTPQKNVDYFDGKNGYTPKKGTDYTDGGYYRPEVSSYWNGVRLHFVPSQTGMEEVPTAEIAIPQGQTGERGSVVHIYAGSWYDLVPGTAEDDDGNSHAYIGRMKYENIVAQSQWEYLMVGDLVLWNSTLYPIVYIDPFAACAFMGEGVDIKGANGTTPHIGSNGNWYIGAWDTGVPSRGDTGRGISGMEYSSDTKKWTVFCTDGTSVEFDGPAIPDVSGYMPKTGGAFTAAVYAKNGVGTSAQLRNTALVSTETYPTVNGQINWQYE